jgi:hypothetical protein
LADLTVAEYDHAEQQAIAITPNRVIEAFQPVLFQQVGYPTRIRRDSELHKYVDAMHELDFQSDFNRLLGGLSEDEFSLLQRLAESVKAFSKTKFGYKAAARSSIVNALNVLRHIKYIFGEVRPRILEIGPGSGYLGAMLMLDSYPYAATDVTQAFYLYQNHFWNFILRGKVNELVHQSAAKTQSLDPVPGNALHIPWWEFAKLEPGSTPNYDVVTCNHVLCEMHPNCLGFMLNIAKSLLKDSEYPLIVFQGWGSGLGQSRAQVNERFYRLGFALVHHDPVITVITPGESKFGGDCLRLPAHRSRLFVRCRNVLRRAAGQRLVHPYEPRHYQSEGNPSSKAIIEGRKSATNSVDLGEIEKFYQKLIGEENHLNADERFWVMAGHRR